MIALVALATFSISASPWIVRTQTNLLGQPETAAELPEAPDAPGKYLKFSCSVMSGPVFEAGLGVRPFEEFLRFSADDAAKSAVISLTFQYGSAILSVRASPVAESVAIHAYSVTGSEAIAAANAAAGAPALRIVAPAANAEFEAKGAAPAIGQVLDACPFKG